ncbi:hypothetical protein JOL79_22305 [Microbispora sp. RL4-1S]|uniref:Uncharacterized protein n=1 Tax=Microbispora oryzae TaxID=2806554 RepID=A0A940WJ96_9ACTN|nr:hypothetical protein [Microbispora oryzae]MBP2706546.1 hypothetical protein [Microbispora oryzae]
MISTSPPEALTRPLPVDLVDGPAGLLYLLPRAPLTVEDCETLSALLAARAAAERRRPRRSPVPDRRPEDGRQETADRAAGGRAASGMVRNGRSAG